MKTLALILTLAIAPLSAQKLDFNIDKMGEKAKERQEIDLDADVLEKLVADLQLPVDSVSRVVVRAYEFAQKGQYNLADLDDLRKQASNTGWKRIVNSKEDDELTEIYAFSQDGKAGGFLIIDAEATELNVVYILGNINMDQLQAVVNSSIQYDMKGLER